MSRPKIHDYFKRKCTEWNITEFLNESKEEPFQLKIGRQVEVLFLFNVDRVSGVAGNLQSLGRASAGPMRAQLIFRDPMPMFVDGTINGAVNNGTIGRVGNINGFIAGTSESKRDREKDLNNEIDNFFQSPSERQSSNLFLRKSEIEQDISNETGNETDHELQDDADSDLDTADNEVNYIWHMLLAYKCLQSSPHLLLKEAIDDQEEVKEATNDVKTNKTGPLRLSEANRREIDTAYNLMDKQYMWKLSSGKFVEEELYKLGKRLEFEHAVHSFILDVEDELIMEHFTETELREIDNTSIPEVPELSNEIDEFLNKFLGKTNLNEIRQIIKESSFGNDYDHEKHHDLDYICLALHSLVREIQNGSIKDTNLENWYNCHVWSVVFDQAFGDIRAIAVVRGESTSISTATRKNKKRKSEERRKIGRRGDWILRAVGNGKKDEFGAGEAGKDWVDEHGTKYIREIGLKLPKTLKDMLVNLMERIKWNEEVRKQIQTIGIIHAGLTMTIVYADNPKGYICRFRRCDLMEVPDTVEKFDSVLTILASVLNAKSVVQETVKMVQTGGQATKSFKSVGLRKRPRDESQHKLSACMSTPKKMKLCTKVNNIRRSYPASPCPGLPNAELLI
ncbi:8290_t:CDS:10 [Ambispora leptoticha]|uniref:8290_t:CDS:1 n=1 Tax=Ambispora leptoticha TaxID=144679 RepID=A0A9N9BEU8_9GLOM|nr:8290_t:CDS:10 [Ambispora leptoticha]